MSGIPTGVQSTSITVQRKAYCHAAGRDAQGQEVNVRCKVIQRLSMLSANGGAHLSGDWLIVWLSLGVSSCHSRSSCYNGSGWIARFQSSMVFANKYLRKAGKQCHARDPWQTLGSKLLGLTTDCRDNSVVPDAASLANLRGFSRIFRMPSRPSQLEVQPCIPVREHRAATE